jgi:endonuclease YncB( thermonuclease family)
LAFLPFSINAYAHPGKLDSKGGHTCRTNCSQYGLVDGQYHYHNGSGFTSTSTLTKTPSAVSVTINGTKQHYDQPPVIDNGRTLVPLRGIFESLGATVQWDANKKTVTSLRGNTKIVLKIGSTSPTVNGKVVPIDVPGKIKNGRTLVPLRFVGEALGATVDYNASNRSIKITSNNAVLANKMNATVISVVDGDTVKVRVNGQEETIRLLLVDTPETVHPNKPVQPFGKEASNYLKSLLPSGKTVSIELDVSERDKYGRLLAYLYVDGKMVNELLLQKGLARVAYVYVPNTRYVDTFRDIQRTAQEQGIGIWSIENYVQEDGFQS